jgi:type II secretory pathway pseudopilin PulG
MCSTRSVFLRKTKNGVTLLESIVVMGVMLVILSATHSFLAGGVNFYQTTVQSLEVQQQALVGITRMASELENTNIDKVLVDGDAIILPSVIAGDGSVATTGSGNLMWQSFICFMPLTLPDGKVVLVRKIETIPGVDHPPSPLSPPDLGAVRDKAYFEPLSSTGVLARNLDTFAATTKTDSITLILSISFSENRTSDKMTIQTAVYPKN